MLTLWMKILRRVPVKTYNTRKISIVLYKLKPKPSYFVHKELVKELCNDIPRKL